MVKPAPIGDHSGNPRRDPQMSGLLVAAVIVGVALCSMTSFIRKP